MDPHTHGHNHKQLRHSIAWGETSPSSLQNMASSMEDHHSHLFFHDQPHHHLRLPILDHHYSSVWQQSSSSDHYNNNYSIPLSHSHQTVSSSPSGSLFFVGSSVAQHHQLTLQDHHHHEHQYNNNHIPEKEHEDQGNNRQRGDLVAAGIEEEEDHDDEVDEELSAMKEMMYKIAAMQPVDIDPSTIRKPKRRNVRISDDPQSVAARHRRERISEKMRILQRLVPGGTKMDTASMLDEAIRYVKFLKRQIRHLQQDDHPAQKQPPPVLTPAPASSKSCFNNTCADDDHLTVTINDNKQLQYVGLFSADYSTATAKNTSSVSLLHHDDQRADDISLDFLNSSAIIDKLQAYGH